MASRQDLIERLNRRTEKELTSSFFFSGIPFSADLVDQQNYTEYMLLYLLRPDAKFRVKIKGVPKYVLFSNRAEYAKFFEHYVAHKNYLLNEAREIRADVEKLAAGELAGWIDPREPDPDVVMLTEPNAKPFSIAVVGSSRSLLDAEQGALIDACDIVIRCNWYTITGFERYTGTKTSVATLAIHRRYLPQFRRFDRERSDRYGDSLHADTIWFQRNEHPHLAMTRWAKERYRAQSLRNMHWAYLEAVNRDLGVLGQDPACALSAALAARILYPNAAIKCFGMLHPKAAQPEKSWGYYWEPQPASEPRGSFSSGMQNRLVRQSAPKAGLELLS